MDDDTGIFIGLGGGQPQRLVLSRANRHGLIAGATGTGKTVTLQGLAEGFSRAGVPVFVADVKGDLAGLAMAGSPTGKMHDAFAARAAEIGDTGWAYGDNPVQFWDLFGEQGHPIRTTVSEMGPLLLARLMDLNEVQEGVLTIAFHVADKDGLLLLDLDDLQAMLADCAERADELTVTYGNVSKASVGTIQRPLLQLARRAATCSSASPRSTSTISSTVDDSGRGIVNILAADKLMASPKLYSTFLLWLLSELFEQLPEVGDPDKPKLVFFFDEAHLLFDERARGAAREDRAGRPADPLQGRRRLFHHPESDRHSRRGRRPARQPDPACAARLHAARRESDRARRPRPSGPIPKLDVATAITELKVGEALVSLLQPDGSPSPVERTLIQVPGSRVGPVTPEERGVLIQTDAIGAKYDEPIDRESAEELLGAKAGEAQAAAAEAKAKAEQAKLDAAEAKQAEKERVLAEREAARVAKEQERARIAAEREAARQAREAAKPSFTDKMVQSAARSAASSVGRQVAGKLGGQLLRRPARAGLFKGR